jgi:uncharacterized protein YggT (Ycf19 family)
MRLLPRRCDPPPAILRRINTAAGALNPSLVAVAIGLSLLDLACILQKLADAASAAGPLGP